MLLPLFLFASETTGNLIDLEPFTMPTRYESKCNNVLIMRDTAKYFKGNEVFNIRFLFQGMNYSTMTICIDEQRGHGGFLRILR